MPPSNASPQLAPAPSGRAAARPSAALAPSEPRMDVSAFHARHPWPAPAEGQPLEWLWHFDLSVTPSELWPWLIDTSTFNRALRHPLIDYEEVDGALRGRCRYNLILHEWEEPPWSWVADRSMVCTRFFDRGAATCLRIGCVLDPLDGGARTRVYLLFSWYPRNPFFRVGYHLSFPPWRRRYRRAFEELERQIGRGRLPPLRRSAPPLSRTGASRLLAAEEELAGHDPEIAGALARHLAQADDVDLEKIRVRELARRLDVAPGRLLSLCLHATRQGVLRLSWDVICPHCRGTRDELPSLGEVPPRGRCEPCAIDFDNDTERSIEVTFRVHPSIRKVPTRRFCAAEPSTKGHILVQARLLPGQRFEVDTGLAPGRYRARLRGRHTTRWLLVGEGPEGVVWRASDAGGADLAAAPSSTVELVNDSDHLQVFVIENPAWSDDALRPADLFNLQQFRDLFSDEHLGVGFQLAVGEQTILFTDIVSSSRLYEARGDGGAFAAVQQHFVVIYDVVRKNHGAIVKTVGDAAMAAFHHPVDGLRAAIEICERFPGGRPGQVGVRVSVNTGTCIAVNLNRGIDYFGATVNAAAKLQACVDGGQVAFPEHLVRRAGVEGLLERSDGELEPLLFETPSLSTPIEALRWTVPRETGSSETSAEPANE